MAKDNNSNNQSNNGKSDKKNIPGTAAKLQRLTNSINENANLKKKLKE